MLIRLKARHRRRLIGIGLVMMIVFVVIIASTYARSYSGLSTKETIRCLLRLFC